MSISFSDAVSEFDESVREGGLDPTTFFSAMGIFQSIIDDGLYVDGMNSVLRSVLERGTRTNALLTAGTFMSLHSSEASTWIVMEHRRKSQFLYMTPVHVLQAPVAGPGYAVDRFRVVDNSASEEISGGSRIEHVAREMVSPKTVVKKSAVSDIIDIDIADLECRNFSVRVSSKPLSPFQINFERNSGRVFGLTPSNPMLSNLTTIFDLLADVSSKSSIEHLEPFAQHEQHFIRWHATRSIYTIDNAIGIKMVETACADTHEQVRAAAKMTLAQLSA